MSSSSVRRARLVVLISGGGRTLKNLQDKISAGEVNAEVVLVIASTAKAGGLRFAHEAGIPAAVVSLGKQQTRNETAASQLITEEHHATVEDFSRAIFSLCDQFSPDLIVLGGFLKLLKIPTAYREKVINIHPALIPAFCGHGFYGHHVHEAVVEQGVKVTGCTVHFVDDQYDHGPIIAQEPVRVLPTDTPDDVAARVFEAECEVYPRVIQAFIEGRVRVAGQKAVILPPTS